VTEGEWDERRRREDATIASVPRPRIRMMADYMAIFAQRTEKVKVRIGGSADPPCPLRRVQRHGGVVCGKSTFCTSPHPSLTRDCVLPVVMHIPFVFATRNPAIRYDN